MPLKFAVGVRFLNETIVFRRNLVSYLRKLKNRVIKAQLHVSFVLRELFGINPKNGHISL
jgi:hypothetical protein